MQAKIITTQEFAPDNFQTGQIQEQKIDSNYISEVNSQTIDNLIDRVRKILFSSKVALDADVQNELSTLLDMLRKAKKLLAQHSNRQTERKAELEAIVLNINVAIDALQNNSSKILAIKVRQEAEYALRRLENPTYAFFANSYQKLLNSTKVATRVLVGLLIALPVNLCLASYIISSLDTVEAELTQLKIVSNSEEARKIDAPVIYVADFRQDYTLIILSFICGSIGSIISIFSRIDEYTKQDSDQRYQHSQLPIFIGLFKPIIGGTFGILTYTIISSGMVPMISLENGESRTRTDIQWLTIISVTFVAGFSERFAKDIVASAENQLNSVTALNQQPHQAVEISVEQVNSTTNSSQEEKQ